MTDRKPRRLRGRKDIGKVVFPIEKLMAGRSASMSCVHIEADLEAALAASIVATPAAANCRDGQFTKAHTWDEPASSVADHSSGRGFRKRRCGRGRSEGPLR